MLANTVSTASSALVLVMPVLWTTSLMISSFITWSALLKSREGCNLQILWDFYAGCQWSFRPINMTALSFPEKSTSVTKEPQFNGDKKRPLDPQDGPGTRHDQPLQRPPGPRWSDLLWCFFVRLRSARGRRIQDFYQRQLRHRGPQELRSAVIH